MSEKYEDYYFDEDEPIISDAEQFAIDCATDCKCGAWAWSRAEKPIHIADCICGAG